MYSLDLSNKKTLSTVETLIPPVRLSSPIPTVISLAYLVYYARTPRSTKLSTAVSVRRTCSLRDVCVCVFQVQVLLKEYNINVSLYIFKYIYTYVYKTRMFIIVSEICVQNACWHLYFSRHPGRCHRHLRSRTYFFFAQRISFFRLFFCFSILSRDQFRLHIATRDGGVITLLRKRPNAVSSL